MQEAFAMTEEEAKSAPHANYTTVMTGGGRTYHVYVYSYLGYGLMAGRAGILAVGPKDGASHPCIPRAYRGEYEYAGIKYPLVGGESESPEACETVVKTSLNGSAECSAPQFQCTFNGAWGGGRVPSVFYISSYFWDRAIDAGTLGLICLGGRMRLVGAVSFCSEVSVSCLRFSYLLRPGTRDECDRGACPPYPVQGTSAKSLRDQAGRHAHRLPKGSSEGWDCAPTP